jgi:hypothetical protein
MHRRLCLLTCLVLLLSLAGNASAQLLARYQFDETSGTIAVDSSIKGNDGIIEKIVAANAGGDPNWVADGTNGCLGFDGNLDVSLPAENMGLRSDSGTVAFWMKMAEVAGGINTIWWGGDNTTGSGFGPENEMHIHVETAVANIWIGGEICFAGQSDPNNFHLHSDPNKGDPAGNEPNDPILVNDNEWHHITCTWGNDDGNAKMYFNGVLLHQMDQGTRSYPLSTLYLGRMAGGGRPYIGLLDDVQIYGRALTEQEIQDVITGGAALTLPASLPLPAKNAQEVPRDSVLSWMTGDTAAKHNVYLGTNFDDVNQANLADPRGVLVSENQEELSFDPLGPGLLDYNQTYYWRVDEIEADGTTIHRGNVWNFTVVNFIVVDDFEAYDVNNIVYESWDDYFVNNTGMTVGYFDPPYIEQKIFHSGLQSLPLRFDHDGTVNDGTALEKSGTLRYSETTRHWNPALDWTKDSVETLSLWFKGNLPNLGNFIEGPAGTYTVTGAGADIYGNADEFHFAYKELTGATEIIAKIVSLDNTDPYAKAGVLVRDTLEPGSRYAGVFMTPDYGVRFQYRVLANGVTDRQFDPNVVIPYWVRLARTSGGLIRAYYSPNGTDWTQFSLTQVSMSGSVYVGIGVTSHLSGVAATGVISNVTMTGTGNNQPWSDVDIGIPSNDSQPMYIAVNGGTPLYYDDPNATTINDWTEWQIPLQRFVDMGVNLTSISSFSIGFGNKANPQAGESGTIFIDDIRLNRP